MDDPLTSYNGTMWDNKYWFPRTVRGVPVGWNDLINKPGTNIYYPKMKDLHWGFLLGAVLVLFRYFLEAVLIIPLGYKLGIKKKRVIHVEANPALEKVYKTTKNIDGTICHTLSKQLDMPVRQIEIWFRKRKAVDSPAKIKKFCENSWQLIFYTVAFIYGCFIIFDKPWLWKTSISWDEWPRQHVETDIYLYYVVELAFYWSLVFTLFADHKRKDFKEMMCHHFATIMLIYFSWLTNMVRVGSLVLLLHDASDPWLAFAKMGIYLKKKSFTDATFGVFVLVWTVSRLVYYPFWVLNNTLIEVFDFIEETFFVYFFFNGMLLVLLVLHFMWTISIYAIIYNTIVKGEVEDTRSDTEDDDLSDVDKETSLTNGNADHINNDTPNGVAKPISAANTNGTTKAVNGNGTTKDRKKAVNGNGVHARNGDADGHKK